MSTDLLAGTGVHAVAAIVNRRAINEALVLIMIGILLVILGMKIVLVERSEEG